MVCICALVPHAVRPFLHWGFQYSKFSEAAIEQARRNELLEAGAVQSDKDFGSWRQYRSDFVNGNTLAALDRIELDKGGSGGSGKALRLDDDDDDDGIGQFGPSSETKVDPLGDQYENSRSGSPTMQTRTPNVFDHGELDDLVQEDFAFVGLFQPDRNTPAPRPGRGAMDGARGNSRGSAGGAPTPHSRGHLDIFDFNDFDDEASYASSRRSSAASDDRVSQEVLSPAQEEAKRREEEATLFMFGHLAKKGGGVDDGDEPQRASRVRQAKKSGASKNPKERTRAKRAGSPNSTVGGGSLKELWQQSSLRTSTMTGGAAQFDDWIPTKPNAASSVGGHSSPISTASPYSAPSPRRGARRRNHKQDDLFDDYYGGNFGSEAYDGSSDGESIPTVATAGNSLDEDEKGLPVPISTLHYIFFPLSVAMLIVFVSVNYILSDRLEAQAQCDTYQNAMGIAVGIDLVVFQSIYAGLTYMFRHLSAEEGDENDDGFYSELHPFEGEIREYFGLGDPTEGLKRTATMSAFGGGAASASMASLRRPDFADDDEEREEADGHVHEWF